MKVIQGLGKYVLLFYVLSMYIQKLVKKHCLKLLKQ